MLKQEKNIGNCGEIKIFKMAIAMKISMTISMTISMAISMTISMTISMAISMINRMEKYFSKYKSLNNANQKLKNVIKKKEMSFKKLV